MREKLVAIMFFASIVVLLGLVQSLPPVLSFQ
jgi:hypothetical protein